MTPKSCSIRWSCRRSSPPFTKNGWSLSSLPRTMRRFGRRMEVITFTLSHTCSQNKHCLTALHQPHPLNICHKGVPVDKSGPADINELFRINNIKNIHLEHHPQVHTLSSNPVIFAWYSGRGLDLPSYCPKVGK